MYVSCLFLRVPARAHSLVFRSVVPGKVQLGPEGANSSQQLATIIQSNLFQDSAALVHVVNRVLIPI